MNWLKTKELLKEIESPFFEESIVSCYRFAPANKETPIVFSSLLCPA